MKAARQVPLDIPLAPGLQDHRFGETPVLPAVEIMGLLARAAAREYPGVAVRRMDAVRFHRFLKFPGQVRRLAAAAVFTPLENGRLHAVLETRLCSRKTPMRRTLRHAELCFGGDVAATPPPCGPWPRPEGKPLELAAQRVYPELVDFGPAFRNLRGRLELSPRGVLAQVSGGPREAAGTGAGLPLGAVFALDAALQAACVWGQLFRGEVTFPTGIEERAVPAPTAPGESYLARVSPRAGDDGDLCFDIWICDQTGRLREAALGVHMRDLSGRRRRPPPWLADLKPGG